MVSVYFLDEFCQTLARIIDIVAVFTEGQFSIAACPIIDFQLFFISKAMNDKGFEAPQNFVYLSARTYQLGQDINTRYQQQLYVKVLFLNLVLRLLTDDFTKGLSRLKLLFL